MEEELMAILLADSGVNALLGGRAYWKKAPQGVSRPYVVLHKIGGNRTHNMQGPDSLTVSRVQIDGYADTYANAKAVERAMDAACDGYSGGNMQGIFHAGSRDGLEGGTNEAERPFLVSVDFIINWSG